MLFLKDVIYATNTVVLVKSERDKGICFIVVADAGLTKNM